MEKDINVYRKCRLHDVLYKGQKVYLDPKSEYRYQADYNYGTIVGFQDYFDGKINSSKFLEPDYENHVIIIMWSHNKSAQNCYRVRDIIIGDRMQVTVGVDDIILTASKDIFLDRDTYCHAGGDVVMIPQDQFFYCPEKLSNLDDRIESNTAIILYNNIFGANFHGKLFTRYKLTLNIEIEL